MIANITLWVKEHTRPLWQLACLALVGYAAYQLGTLYAPGGPAQARMTAGQGTARAIAAAPKPTPDHSDPRVVVSKSSSSKKYHHTWCASANRIKEANRVWFASAAVAQAAGYSLAGNCTE